MDKEMISKFERNVGKAKEVKIGDDSFDFIPLPLENFIEFLQVGEELENARKEGKNLPKEVLESISKLIDIMVSESYPELDEKTRRGFVSYNFFTLTSTLMELNLPNSNGLDDKKKAALDRLKSQLEQANEKQA